MAVEKGRVYEVKEVLSSRGGIYTSYHDKENSHVFTSDSGASQNRVIWHGVARSSVNHLFRGWLGWPMLAR